MSKLIIKKLISCDRYFINISNHHSNGWSKKQFKTANEIGNIINVEFPQIDPRWSVERVKLEAEDMLKKIIKIANNNKSTVHIIGEQSFCYCLINMIVLHNITAKNRIRVALSTTERERGVDKNGMKYSKFEFVKFRILN